MRNKYYTKNNIDKKADEFKSELSKMGLIKGNYSIPSSTALLILDMQNYFLDASSHAFIPSAETIIPKIDILKNEFDIREMPIIFTQHINDKANAGMMSVWWKDLIADDNTLHEIPSKVLDTNSTIIKKNQYDAFWNTNLEEILHNNGITDLVITGLMTHLCCETTARAAFVRGFNVIFTVDCTATLNENHHLSSLINIAHGFAHIQTVSEVIENLP